MAIGGACARGPLREHTALLTWTFTPPKKTRSLPCLSQELKKQELRASGGMAISANQMLSALAEKEREKQKKKALKREQKVRDAPHILLTSAVCSCVTLRLHCKSESLRARPSPSLTLCPLRYRPQERKRSLAKDKRALENMTADERARAEKAYLKKVRIGPCADLLRFVRPFYHAHR